MGVCLLPRLRACGGERTCGFCAALACVAPLLRHRTAAARCPVAARSPCRATLAARPAAGPCHAVSAAPARQTSTTWAATLTREVDIRTLVGHTLLQHTAHERAACTNPIHGARTGAPPWSERGAGQEQVPGPGEPAAEERDLHALPVGAAGEPMSAGLSAPLPLPHPNACFPFLPLVPHPASL